MARRSGRTDITPSSLRLDRDTQTESIVEVSRPEVQSTVSNLTIGKVGSSVHLLENISGIGVAASISGRLYSYYAWGDRTITSRHSQWDTRVEFCIGKKREILPVTQGHFISFIGWLANKRHERRKKISSSSIPQYLSAVHQIQ